ncbi:MAG: single-stranded DNA-binding protein [Elusimicrobiota bacterium]|jgi:single-strand DNA-binding protein|nr:single-stranded DNA-binding protein [Elusimicrobiota bacterium]
MAENLRMPEMNKIFLIGRVTKDLELRYTPSNQAVVTFTIASSRNYKDGQTGEWKEIASFVPVVAWGKQAEMVADRLKKGSAVYVEGRLQSRNWENKQGEKRSTLEVIADRFQFLTKLEKTGNIVSNNNLSDKEYKNSNWDVEDSVEKIDEEEIPF